MENRIQINGVWYVREDVSNSNEIQIDITEDITYFSGCVYENDKYCWEVTVIEPHKYGNSVNLLINEKNHGRKKIGIVLSGFVEYIMMNRKVFII